MVEGVRISVFISEYGDKEERRGQVGIRRASWERVRERETGVVGEEGRRNHPA